jgi:hypothetical protein
MRPLKLLILAGLILTISSGCKWSFWQIDKPVYVAPGQKAEVAKRAKIRCWVTNKETGKRELRIIEAETGWWIARPKEAEIKPAEIASEVK